MTFLLPKTVGWNESAIRPMDKVVKWRELLRQEVQDKFLLNSELLMNCPCPGCGAGESERAFEMFGMIYHDCAKCGTLFVSPRPTQAAIDNFYLTSSAIQFWSDEVIKQTKAERRDNHWQPSANWLAEVVGAYCPGAKVAIEYRPKFYSVFHYLPGDHIKKVIQVSPISVEEPKSPTYENEVVPDLSVIGGKVDVVVAFNVIEREESPKQFLHTIIEKMEVGGLLFITTNTISGFEYQVLREHSHNLVPPDRLQLLSVEALEQLLEEVGLEIIELGTPGRLDVDIVTKEYFRNSDLPIPAFLKYIFQHRDVGVLSSLQNFLQLNNLSSFLRAVAIKRK